MNDYPKNQKKVVEAAGGILWKKTSSGRLKLAIIHRKRYDDWTLPKGKREPGESWHETALREVMEETCCQATIGSFIGGATYVINGQTPKIVLFWHMTANMRCEFIPNSEVDRIKWVSPQKALKMLDYEDERNILIKAMDDIW